MKTKITLSLAALATCLAGACFADEISLATAPPVVVQTVPMAGATNVDPALAEIHVTYSKAMLDGDWSWLSGSEGSYPKTTGNPHYLEDGRTCVLPVKLEPGKFYALWLNSEQFKNFKDADGRPAVPYLLTFTTAREPLTGATAATKGFEYLVQRGDTLAGIANAYREQGIAVTVDEILKANPGLDPKKLTVGQRIFVPAGTPARGIEATATPERKFVRVVLDDKQMTFEGQATSWDKLDALLSAVPDRGRTVLEWGIPSTQITIQQQNNWSHRFAELARKYGFEYSSYVGVQAFGSHGGTPPVARPASGAAVPESELRLLLNDDQKAVIAWTDRQFRPFFDRRTFDGWSPEDLKDLEAKSIDALNGPRSREYYQAINTLGALRSTNALPRLRQIAFERVDRNNRDRWMAVRALGIIGDLQSIPDLIHLVYHGNPNTHWWAQVSLVQLTGQNFGGDWEDWGKWWNDSGGQPAYNPEIIRWWNGQAEPDKLAESLAESDRKFLASIR